MFQILTLALISLLGAMSPGPDFAIVTRHALTGSRKSALLASLGVATALCIHIIYCVLGVAIVIKESPLIFRGLQIGGSLYLAYLGAHLLITSSKKAPPTPARPGRAFASGLLTNLLNPKATLFLLSVFSQFVNPETPLATQILYGFVIILTALLWFGILSFLITHPRFRPAFAKFQKRLMLCMGIILLGLAAVVLLSL